MSRLHNPINLYCIDLMCLQEEPHDHGFECDNTCTMCAADCGSACPACNDIRSKELEGLVTLDRVELKDHHNGGIIGEVVYIDGELSSFEVDLPYANRILTGTYKGFRLAQTSN